MRIAVQLRNIGTGRVHWGCNGCWGWAATRQLGLDCISFGERWCGRVVIGWPDAVALPVVG